MKGLFANKILLAITSIFLAVAAASAISFSPLPVVVPAEASGIENINDSHSTSYAPGDEIISERTENSKKFYLGNNKYALDVSIGAIHYKDNYSNKQEQWKDIDLTFINSRITKAPYILSVNPDEKSFAVQDKKTGRISAIKLTKIGDKYVNSIQKKSSVESKGRILWSDFVPNLDIAISAGNTRVSFDWIVKSEDAPHEVEFELQDGGIPIIYKGIDNEGTTVTVTTQKSGNIVIERIDKGGKYPKTINPTIDTQVGANSDDCLVWWLYYQGWSINITDNAARGVGEEFGEWGPSAFGAGFRFTGITIPGGSTITTAYLTMCSCINQSGTTCNSKITGNKQNNPATFSTLEDFQSRRGTIAGGASNSYITSAQVNWDNIGSWTAATEYNSPEIKTIIQELVDAHAPNNEPLALFWDDYDKRSSASAYRLGRAYWYFSPNQAAKLHIEHTGDDNDSSYPEVGVWWIEDYAQEDGGPLPYSYESAVGFMNRLLNASWVRGFYGVGQLGDTNVREVQFKKVGSGNGDDIHYSDGIDIAYFSGHGGAGVINGNINGPRLTTQNDDKYVEYSECEWGDFDLEWIMFDCCQVLDDSDARNAWHGTMKGLHLICGAITVEYNDDNGVHVSDLLIDDGLLDYARTVKTSWFEGMDYDNPSSVQLCVIGETSDCGDDYIWVKGLYVPTQPMIQIIALGHSNVPSNQ